MEIQQAPFYAEYIRKLGWTVETVNHRYLFIKSFPFLGSIIKIQRLKKLPHLQLMQSLIKKYHVRTIAIEPDSSVSEPNLRQWVNQIKSLVRINNNYFLPTKTIRIDLTPPVEVIFSRFSEAKRRAVRRAQKNNIAVSVSQDICSLITLKNHAAGFLGFITTYGLEKMWSVFPKKNKAVILASAPSVSIPVAGILLFIWDDIAYYWVAGSSKLGKKLFAPTILVSEALQEAKRRGCQTFDFVGVWDERLPKINRQWQGFTKFKEGFGGTIMYYPLL